MGALAGEYNFTIEQGVTLEKTFTYYQADGTTPVNLTGYTARMNARDRIEDSTKVIDLTTENGGIELGGVAGTVTLLLTAAQAAALTFDDAVYDIELIPASGAVERFLQGRIMLSKEVTR